jgi:hypothetical protein
MLGTTNSVIPSVQVGAGIPLQSTSAVGYPSAIPQPSLLPVQGGAIAQSAMQQSNMAPVQSGSIMQVPPGTMVPVQAGGSIVMVPTQPVATQSVQMSVQPQYQTTSYQPQVETTYQTQVETEPQLPYEPAPSYGQTTTPQLKTLQPKIVRNQLPPQHKTVTLPAKIVTTRLPPIGPPPTPELNLQLPPAQTIQSVVVPEPVQPVQSVQTVMVPQPVPIQSVVVPQYQTLSVPTMQTASLVQPSAPKYGSTSIIAQY